MMQSKIIAITGGIGSGKSTVAAIIKEKGYPVYSCDEIYHSLLQTDLLKHKLKIVFHDAFETNGEINLKKLSNIIFKDPQKKILLESITHPMIMQTMIDQAKKNQIAFCEVPLLFEGNYIDLFDQAIIVKRPLEDRIVAVMERSNLTREEVKQRIDAQFDYDDADLSNYYIINNNGDYVSLQSKVANLINEIINFQKF